VGSGLREMSKFIASVAQLGSVPFDPAASAEKAVRAIARAAAVGSKLLVFPEAFLGFYPKGANFGAVVGARSREGRIAFQRYYESAIDVPGPETSLMAEATREAGAFVVAGAIERDQGTLYCTALFFDPDKGLVGKHRKLMPTAAERLIWGFGDGSTMRVFDSAIGRIGAVICWENYMPMLRMHMYAQGVTLYCAPTADDRETWLPTTRHIALEGRCFRADGLPAHQTRRLSRRLRMHFRRRSQHGADARRECHYRSSWQCARGSGFRR
jgi:nitrilase